MRQNAWQVARLMGGAAILAVLVWRLGTGPFLAGLRSISVGPLAAAVAIGAVTTVCAAWRWRLVARGLGVDVPLPAATAAYYRAQFLNTALPCGVLGDVHRGVDHGRQVGDVGRGLRAVGWERLAGQVVQIAVAVVVLMALPSPVRAALPGAVAIAAVAVLVAVLIVRALAKTGETRAARIARTAAGDVRGALLGRHAWPGVLLASVVVVAGHVATFVIAARAAGSTGSVGQLAPLALLALLAMAVPMNIGGWGPREGVAAWAFAAAGLGADHGLAAATVYGVLVFAACLPGAAVLIVAALRRRAMIMHAPSPGRGSVHDHRELVSIGSTAGG
ncbi:MAG TPA: lysylphosphatidylglycerol synthase transmembrane domain-containing protein [Jatrophihabitans sp.]|nr:lysylphosphatidylglycerol synthase transmembrane domain-containing protein [Jatrophihabitans sp.]